MNKDVVMFTIDTYESRNYVNDPKDRGGPTKFGITLKTLRSYFGDPTLTAEDVRNLTIEVAVEIFGHVYWTQPKIDLLPQPLQHITFDMCVLHGVGKGPELLQRGVRSLLGDRPATDGSIGPKTAVACKTVLEEHNVKEVIASIVNARVNFMNGIVSKDPTQKKYIDGWLTRARSFLALDPLVYTPKVKPAYRLNIKPSPTRGKRK